jgi:hypothetical protein
MSAKLNRPPKPEESQKDSNFNGKTILYPGFEPRTFELAVITTAPFGSVPVIENSVNALQSKIIAANEKLVH